MPLDEWMFKLGTPNQGNGVPYVMNSRCYLCNTGVMHTRRIMKQHLNGSRHSLNYQKVVCMQNAQREREEEERLREEREERKKRLIMLELAMWKHSICDGVIFSSVEEMREYPVLEEGFDPVEYSKSMLVKSGSEEIVSLVACFLP